MAERVAEHVRALVGLAQDGGPEQFGQGPGALVLVQSGEGGQRLLPCRGGEHGRRRRQRVGLRRQQAEPFDDRLAQAARGVRVLEPVHRLAVSMGSAVLGEGDQVLLGDQRQALAAPVEGGAEGGGGVRAEGFGGQFLDLGLRQRAEPDHRASGAGRVAVGGAEHGGSRRQVLGPVGEDEAQPGRQVAGEQEEQVAGGLVRPVQVLDDQRRRAERGEERPYGLEQLETPAGEVGRPLRRGGSRSARSGRSGVRAPAVGGKPGRPSGRPCAARRPPARTGTVRAAVAEAGQHLVPFGAERDRRLADQPGLADAGLPSIRTTAGGRRTAASSWPSCRRRPPAGISRPGPRSRPRAPASP
ncbi:hypothetical protein O1L60_33730 [Streptomyces diastatochromogenes]|nr:hypothetical protein [Streptomyces diastatochromogenes]